MPSHPPIPGILEPPAFMLDLEKEWYEVCAEVLDKKFVSRTHGNPRTYDAGCRGPYCSKSLRERARRRTSGTPAEKYKYLDPIVDYFWQVAVKMIDDRQEAILKDLCWYTPPKTSA